MDKLYQELLHQEQNSAEQGRADRQRKHETEVEALEEEGREKIRLITVDVDAYEATCHTKYAEEVERQTAAKDKARNFRLDSASGELQEVSQTQFERATMFESIKTEADALVSQKYERILAQLSENWQKESEDCDQKYLERARSYWESHSEAVERQLDVTRSTMAKMYEGDLLRWQDELEKAKQQEEERLKLIEELETDVYEEQLAILQETLACRKQAAMEELDATQTSSTADDDSEAQLEQTFAKALEMEKSAYQQDWQASWAPVELNLEKLNAMYKDEMQGSLKEYTEAEELAIQTVLEAKEAGLNARDPSSPEFSLSDGSAKTQLKKVLPALEKVWAALEVPATESGAFLDTATQALSQTQSLQHVFEMEAAKLTDRLPIMKTLSRRELLLAKLSETKMGAENETRQNFKEVKLKGDIQQLDESLRRLIPLYEETHRERFMFQGKSYLEKMSDDTNIYF